MNNIERMKFVRSWAREHSVSDEAAQDIGYKWVEDVEETYTRAYDSGYADAEQERH